MIEFLDPRAEPAAAPEPYQLAANLGGGGAATVGLLANGFPDSESFLDRVAEVLVELVPDIELRRYNKGNASVLADDQLLDGISKECKAVVTAYGH